MNLIEMSEAHNEPWHPYEHSDVIREYEESPLDPYANVPAEAKKNALTIAGILKPAEAKAWGQGSSTGAREDAECDGVGVAFNVPDFEGRGGTIRVNVDFSMHEPDEQGRSLQRDVYFIYPNGIGILNKTIFSYGDESQSSYRVLHQRFVTRGEIPVLGVALASLAK